METEINKINFIEEAVMNAVLEKPIVFEYMSFRDFISDQYNFLKQKNPKLSESAFIQKAGYGANSRGYLKLIKTGKRNLSHKAVIGFSKFFKLKDKESKYFENLVWFSQSKKDEDKRYYFSKLEQYVKGKETPAYFLLSSQFRYLSHWYLVAIRELVTLDDFVEDAVWISEKLRKAVKPSQVEEAINDLLILGMLKRDENGVLKQIESIIRFSDNIENYQAVTSFHKQILEIASNRIDSDQYQDRSASNINFVCAPEDFDKIRAEIADFRKVILEKYGTRTTNNKNLLSMSVQLVHLAEIDGQGDKK